MLATPDIALPKPVPEGNSEAKPTNYQSLGDQDGEIAAGIDNGQRPELELKPVIDRHGGYNKAQPNQKCSQKTIARSNLRATHVKNKPAEYDRHD